MNMLWILRNFVVTLALVVAWPVFDGDPLGMTIIFGSIVISWLPPRWGLLNKKDNSDQFDEVWVLERHDETFVLRLETARLSMSELVSRPGPRQKTSFKYNTFNEALEGINVDVLDPDKHQKLDLRL